MLGMLRCGGIVVSVVSLQLVSQNCQVGLGAEQPSGEADGSPHGRGDEGRMLETDFRVSFTRMMVRLRAQAGPSFHAIVCSGISKALDEVLEDVMLLTQHTCAHWSEESMCQQQGLRTCSPRFAGE